jgi:hypothetical protein
MDELSARLRKDVPVKIAYVANNYKPSVRQYPSLYRDAEKAAMDTLRVMVRHFVDCCFLQGRGTNTCSSCILSQQEIYESLMLKGFRQVNNAIPTTPGPNVNSSVTIEDYAVLGLGLADLMKKELNAMAAKNYTVSGYITKDFNLCDGKYDLAEQNFNTSSNRFRLWWHLWLDPASKKLVLLEKINDIDAYLLAKYPSPPDHFNGTNAEPCHTTKRLGKSGTPEYRGTIEHWCIELDYVNNINPNASAEYLIPDAGTVPKYPGYPDLVDVTTGEIFEIKHESDTIRGRAEVSKYVAKAKAYCPNTANWKRGTNYPATKTIPRSIMYPVPDKKLQAWLSESGLIVYKISKGNPDPQPEPISIPAPTVIRIKDFIERQKKKQDVNIDDAIRTFLQENPDIVEFVKVACVTAAFSIVIGTIIEDIVTLGAGILDDIPSFYLAYRLVRIAAY